jgi:hypothetical protein
MGSRPAGYRTNEDAGIGIALYNHVERAHVLVSLIWMVIFMLVILLWNVFQTQ